MAKTAILDLVEIVPLTSGPFPYAFRAKRDLTQEETMEACELLAILNGTEGGHFTTVKDDRQAVPMAQPDEHDVL